MSFALVSMAGSTGAGIGGAILNSNAASDAADKQSAAAAQASALQYQMYQQQRADNEPWRLAGGRALTGMEDSDFQRDFKAEDFQKDPGYDFRMQEGQKALERSASARGGLQGGAFGRALSRYGQDFASNEYGNAYNRFNADRDRRFGRLSKISDYGINVNNANAQGGQNYASNAGQNMMDSAGAQGAADIATANAWSGAMNGVTNNAMTLATGGMGGGNASGNNGNWMSKSSNSYGNNRGGR